LTSAVDSISLSQRNYYKNAPPPSQATMTKDKNVHHSLAAVATGAKYFYNDIDCAVIFLLLKFKFSPGGIIRISLLTFGFCPTNNSISDSISVLKIILPTVSVMLPCEFQFQFNTDNFTSTSRQF